MISERSRASVNWLKLRQLISRPLAEITKMNLARRLQLRDQLTPAERDDLWSATKDVLLAALIGDDIGAGEAAAAFAIRLLHGFRCSPEWKLHHRLLLESSCGP